MGVPVEGSSECILYELESGSTLNGAGGNDGPETLTGFPSVLTSGALGYMAIHDDKTQCLFGDIVGWVDAGRSNKLEVGVAVF